MQTVVSASGRLAGASGEDQLPTILVVAHYDAGGGAPGLAEGADSNGSGVAMLLELARLFSALYASSRNIHSRQNNFSLCLTLYFIVFFLNFSGTGSR